MSSPVRQAASRSTSSKPRSSWEIAALGPPEPVALLVRPRDGRPLHRRRRPGRGRGGRLHAARRARASRTTAGIVYEGSQRYEDGDPGPGKLVFPVFEYAHDRGCTVTGGYVYRGTARPAERGRYVVRRLLQRDVWSFRVSAGEGVGSSEGAVQDRRASPRSARTPPASSTRSLDGHRYARRSLARGREPDVAERADRCPRSAGARRTRGGACPSAAYASAFSDSVSSRSSRATSVKPVLLLGRPVQPLELVRDAVEPLEQRVELAVSDVLRAPRARFYDARARSELARRARGRRRRRPRALRGVARARPRPSRAPTTRRVRAELGERDARERLGRVGEDAERRARSPRARAAPRSSPRLGAGRRARAPRRSARAARASCPRRAGRAPPRPSPRSAGSASGSTPSTRAGRLEPVVPERPRVAERVEVDRDGARVRHASRRARTDCQRTTPTATPTASIATSSGEPMPARDERLVDLVADRVERRRARTRARLVRSRVRGARRAPRTRPRARACAARGPSRRARCRGRAPTRTRRSAPPRRGRGARGATKEPDTVR